MNGNYDMGRKGWVYYITDSGQSGNQRHTLWGYNLRRNNSQRIYATGNEMFFPNSDSRGRILVYMEGKDKMIMEVDADKGTTRSIATFTGKCVVSHVGQQRKEPRLSRKRRQRGYGNVVPAEHREWDYGELNVKCDLYKPNPNFARWEISGSSSGHGQRAEGKEGSKGWGKGEGRR